MMDQVDEQMAQLVYDSLWGGLVEGYRLPWVERADAPDHYCMKEYGKMLDAYQRLVERLNEVDDDPDGEIMINALLDIQQYLGLKMFEYGVLYAKKYCCD